MLKLTKVNDTDMDFFKRKCSYPDLPINQKIAKWIKNKTIIKIGGLWCYLKESKFNWDKDQYYIILGILKNNNDEFEYGGDLTITHGECSIFSFNEIYETNKKFKVQK